MSPKDVAAPHVALHHGCADARRTCRMSRPGTQVKAFLKHVAFGAEENLVKFASFGPKGAVIVVLKSGAYYFRNLPLHLQDCITGRARSGNEDHNRIASVSLGNNDAFFVTFESVGWKYNGIPKSMHEHLQEHKVAQNISDETFQQIAFTQDLEDWYFRTSKRWYYKSSSLRKLEDTYKK
ncbi:unnamed protein product [Effrenium voratum]|nr:unnamed protein product [Effrenium voratum]